MTESLPGGGETLLLTGAQGFLGRHIAVAWLRAHPGGRVVGVGRSSPSATHFTYHHAIGRSTGPAPLPGPLAAAAADPRYEYRRVDLTDATSVRSLVAAARPMAVVHSAAALRGEPLSALISANVLGTACLARALGETPDAPRLVLVSSGSVYGLDETSRSAEQPEPYAVTKRWAERAAATEAAFSGLRVVSARVFNLIGPGLQVRHLPALVSFELAILERTGGRVLRLGSLEARRDLIDARDAAEGVVAIASASDDAVGGLPEHDGLPVVDVGTGIAHRMRDVVLAQITAMGLDGRVDVVESEQRAMGAAALSADPRALTSLGPPPRTSIDETLREMAAYARSHA